MLKSKLRIVIFAFFLFLCLSFVPQVFAYVAVPLLGSQPFVTILCRNGDLTYTPNTKEDYETIMQFVNHYWTDVSYGQMNLNGSIVAPGNDQFGWYNQDPSSGLPYGGCLDAAAQRLNIPDYYGINFILNNGSLYSATGTREVFNLNGVTKEYAFIQSPAEKMIHYSWPFDLFAHEGGHSFGLLHSVAYRRETASLWDVMAYGTGCGEYQDTFPYGCKPIHPIAYDKDLLGWIPGERKYVATAGSKKTVFIERLANPPFQEGAYLMAKIPISNTEAFYTVEARMKIGYDEGIPNDAIIIHKVWRWATTNSYFYAELIDGDNDNDPYDDGVEWQVGETFFDEENDIQISIDEKRETGYVVTVANQAPASTPNPACQYDYDVNGSIGIGDLLHLLNNWDSNGITKIIQILTNWGTDCNQ
jgi:hypothetical protein